VEPFVIEIVVAEDGSLTVQTVPFAPGTKLLVTLEEAEPMDAESFDEALRKHYKS
jgi:hypothetical protein